MTVHRQRAQTSTARTTIEFKVTAGFSDVGLGGFNAKPAKIVHFQFETDVPSSHSSHSENATSAAIETGAAYPGVNSCNRWAVANSQGATKKNGPAENPVSRQAPLKFTRISGTNSLRATP